MPITVTHATVATGTDQGNGEIGKAEWNAEHIVTGESEGTGSDVVTSNRIYYVSPSGFDSNDGLSAVEPFLTIEHAIETVSRLDLDHKDYSITVQLAPGTYTPIGGILAFKDPKFAWTATSPAIENCVLLGNPTNPETVIIDGRLQFRETTRWRISGVRIQSSGAFVSLVSVRNHCWVTLDSIDFHISQPFQSICSLRTWARASVHGRVTQSGSGSILGGFSLYEYCYGIFAIDFVSTTIELAGTWMYVDYNSEIEDISNYGSASNVFGAGAKYEIYWFCRAYVRGLHLFPGVHAGSILHPSAIIISKNSYTPTLIENTPFIVPTDTVLGTSIEAASVSTPMNYGTITNQGASSMVQYTLPGEGELYYTFAYRGAGYPWGLRFGFVVANAVGIRISAAAGWSINVAGVIGGKVESTVVGSSMILLSTGEFEWTATSVLGTWVVTEQVTSVSPPTLPATAPGGTLITCPVGTWSSAVATQQFQWLLNGVAYGGNDNRWHQPSFTHPGGVLACRTGIIDVNGTGSVIVVTNDCTGT